MSQKFSPLSGHSDHGAEFILRRIPHATLHDNRLTFVRPTDPVSLALTRMVACEYSQMPVLAEHSNGPATLHGVLTWQSITRALLSDLGGALPVCDIACDSPERFDRFSVDTSIVDIIHVLFERDFILTFDTDSFYGIMTSADLVRWADEHAMGLVEVRRLEFRLRDLCETFAQNKGKRQQKMNFRDYKRKLVDETKAWDLMAKSGAWRGVSREEFRNMFNEASRARNAIFHFGVRGRPRGVPRKQEKVGSTGQTLGICRA